MQQVKAFLTVLVTFITFIFTSVIIGYVIGFIAVLLNSGGMFTPWKPLPSPMEFIQIKDATSHIIWTQSKDGKYYAWDSYCFDQAKCNEWVEVKDIPDNLHTGGERSVKRGATCGELGFDYLTSNLPKNVRECVKTGFAGPEFGTSVYYALLDNGQIWMWEHGTSLIEIQVLPLLCGFLGLFAGIIGFVVFMIRRITKNKQSTASPVNIPMPYEPVIGLEVHAVEGIENGSPQCKN